ncbi:MAG: Fic family protein [Deltaproteobacteria bacterium]|nr:Fic family protein [Deltaproteobacteria bacterium]
MQYNYYDLKKISAGIKKLLETADSLKIQIDNKKSLQKERMAALQEKLRIDWTYNSNAIEGSSLTMGETLFFLKEGLTVEGKPFKDFIDAKNHSEAINLLYDVITDKRLVTQSLIKEINALLLFGVKRTSAMDEHGKRIQKPASPGKYKTLPNHVLQMDGTIHFYTDPIYVADEMEILCRFINDNIDKIHPIILSSAAHYNMVRIHPFDDGNGRGARILTNLILMKQKYPMAIIKTENRRQYLTALNKADKGDIYPFLNLTANSLINTANIIIEELS